MASALNKQREAFEARNRKLQASLAQDEATRRGVAEKVVAPPPERQTHWSQDAKLKALAQQQAGAWSSARDAKELQAALRKAPLASRIRTVLTTLLQDRGQLTASDLLRVTGIDVLETDIINQLRNNVKVDYNQQDGTYAYKSKHNVKDKAGLLKLIRMCKEGIAVSELKDSYPGVTEDIEAFRDSGLLWLLPNTETQDEIAYPNDPKAVIKVDQDIKDLIRGIDLPRDPVDIERELEKAGLKPAMNTAARKAAMNNLRKFLAERPRDKKKRESKRTKYTNMHMPELFNGGGGMMPH